MTISQRSSMLDLVRRTCDDARGMADFEGVYEPDPEQVESWQNQEAETYGGEFRFVNLGPAEVKRRVESAENPEDMEALRIAESFWQKAGGYSGQMEAGYVDRGDAREAIRAGSMSELAASVKPAAVVTAMGSLEVGGIPTQSGPIEPGDYRDSGIIDWSYLMNQGPLEETDDWF